MELQSKPSRRAKRSQSRRETKPSRRAERSQSRRETKPIHRAERSQSRRETKPIHRAERSQSRRAERNQWFLVIHCEKGGYVIESDRRGSRMERFFKPNLTQPSAILSRREKERNSGFPARNEANLAAPNEANRAAKRSQSRRAERSQSRRAERSQSRAPKRSQSRRETKPIAPRNEANLCAPNESSWSSAASNPMKGVRPPWQANRVHHCEKCRTNALSHRERVAEGRVRVASTTSACESPTLIRPSATFSRREKDIPYRWNRTFRASQSRRAERSHF